MSLFQRIVAAAHVLCSRRVLVIDVRYDHQRDQDKCTMWTTMPEVTKQIEVMRGMADAVEEDFLKESTAKLTDTTTQIN